MSSTFPHALRHPLSDHLPAALVRAEPRVVRCYHCRRAIEVSGRAITITCPVCYGALSVADLVIKDTHWGGRLHSCGKIVVRPRARVIAKTVRAVEAVEVYGSLQADVECLGVVVIGARAVWRGNLTASAVRIEPGAVIEAGVFRIAADIGEMAIAEGVSSHAPTAGDAPGDGAVAPPVEAVIESPAAGPAWTRTREAGRLGDPGVGSYGGAGTGGGPISLGRKPIVPTRAAGRAAC